MVPYNGTNEEMLRPVKCPSQGKGFNLTICLRWKKLLFTTAHICFSKCRSMSKITPKFLGKGWMFDEYLTSDIRDSTRGSKDNNLSFALILLKKVSHSPAFNIIKALKKGRIRVIRPQRNVNLRIISVTMIWNIIFPHYRSQGELV